MVMSISEENSLQNDHKRDSKNNNRIVLSPTKTSDTESDYGKAVDDVDEADSKSVDSTVIAPGKEDYVPETQPSDDDISKTEEVVDLLTLDADSKSLRSFVKFSSRESSLTTLESIKDFHGELNKFASSEDLKKTSIEKISPSNTDISEEKFSESYHREITFNRTEIIERCRSLLAERRQLMLKNILLQKKLYDYFKKKKAEGMYREGESTLAVLGGGQIELQYRKKLMVFEDAVEKDANERAKIETDSRKLFQRKEELVEYATTQVDSLLKLEEMYGRGLIDSSSGKALSEKVVLTLINRQRQLTNQLTGTMLKYIQVRDEVSEKEKAIKALEDVGEDLHLIDYEQLCVEKRVLYDKIEERDKELGHLREKIETSVLALSHIHEKMYDTDQSIESNLRQLNELTHFVQMSREERTKAKKQLIHIRNEIENLQNKAGLLIHHSLLRDFENVLSQIAEVEQEVNQMKKATLWEKKPAANEESSVSKQSNDETPSTSHFGSTAASYSKREMKIKQPLGKSRDKKYKKPSHIVCASEQLHPKIHKGRPSIVKFLPAVD